MRNLKTMIPRSLAELQQMLACLPEGCKVLAGGTDLIIAMRHNKVAPSALLYVGDVPEMIGISCGDDCVRIGASTTMHGIANHSVLREEFTALCDAAADIGSAQIRNNATIGGNLGNASPAADLTPCLWLFDTQVEILSPQGIRSMAISELIVGAEQLSLRPDEVIIALLLPRNATPGVSAYAKVGSRAKVTISRVGVAFAYAPDTEKSAIVLGAITPTPVFVPQISNPAGRLNEADMVRLGEALSGFVLEVNNRPNRIYKSWAVKGAWEDAYTLAMQRLR